MEGLYNRRIVRTFIIDGSDRLKVPGAYSKLKESPLQRGDQTRLLCQ